jgi:hypothetical protein
VAWAPTINDGRVVFIGARGGGGGGTAGHALDSCPHEVSASSGRRQIHCVRGERLGMGRPRRGVDYNEI